MKNIYKWPFLDFNALNEDMIAKNLKSYQKLPYMYESIGGEFHDEDKQIMKGAVLALTSIGGFPIELSNNGELLILGKETTITDIKEHLYKTVGMSSFMSYLNPKNKTLSELSDAVISLKHLSCLHTVHISVIICGITSGVEHELSSQRDIIHLSRLTVAKTIAQNAPCLVLNNENYYEKYKKVLELTKNVVSGSLDDAETRNLLFPAAKASAIILTGSIKNFLKLIQLKDSGGKEDELVTLLKSLEHLIQKIFPELFI
jgi:hypothetical protein